MPPKATKDRILDAAEQLFSEVGFGQTSLRAVTAEAGANLAAVHYHFGSKEALIQAVLARRVAPINRERLELLEEAEDEAGDDPPDVEAILHAFLWPALRLSSGPRGKILKHLVGTVYGEPGEHVEFILTELFGEVGHRFGEALQRALPHLDPYDVHWRFFFMLGSMAFTLADRRKLKVISGGLCDSGDVEMALEEMVAFLAGGMRADAPTLSGEVS